MGRILHESVLLDKQWRGTLKTKQKTNKRCFQNKSFSVVVLSFAMASLILTPEYSDMGVCVSGKRAWVCNFIGLIPLWLIPSSSPTDCFFHCPPFNYTSHLTVQQALERHHCHKACCSWHEPANEAAVQPSLSTTIWLMSCQSLSSGWPEPRGNQSLFCRHLVIPYS